MRLECCASSLLSSRSAATENSIFHAMTLHYVFKGNGVVLTIADAFQRALGEIQVLKIFQVWHDGFGDRNEVFLLAEDAKARGLPFAGIELRGCALGGAGAAGLNLCKLHREF